ncbi:MAG: PAS domain-containing protein, partial [Desulfocapsa sp.]|nr:PAS domain-containing protein [Desulfocapsa sp.]
MLNLSITLKILLLVACTFICMSVGINTIANQFHLKLLDTSQNAVYSEKLQRAKAKLERSHERLQETRMTDVSTEDFKASVIQELKKVFYQDKELVTYPFILDHDGKVIMHPTMSREDDSLQEHDWVKTMISADTGEFTADYLGQENWFIHSKFPPWNWTVCYILPLETKYREATDYRNILTIIITGVSVFSLLILGLIIPKFTMPITELTSAVKAVADGNFEQKINATLNGTNEVKSLTHSFINMRDSINKTILELKEEINKRREVEKQLLKQKDHLQSITENVPGVIYQASFTSNGEIRTYYTSPKLYDIFGVEPTDDPLLLRQNFIENIHEDDMESWKTSVQNVVKKQIPWNWKGRYIKPSGELIWFEGRSIPTVHEDEVIFDGIYFDITENIKREEQKLEVSLQKEQLKKLESLKTMAGAIAHRFNNAMTAVQGNLELMTRILTKDSTEHKMASDAASAATDASQIGSRMLSYVGQQQLKLQTIPLEVLVKESFFTFKNSLNPAISLKFTPP